jgi:hypothetical protein
MSENTRHPLRFCNPAVEGEGRNMESADASDEGRRDASDIYLQQTDYPKLRSERNAVDGSGQADTRWQLNAYSDLPGLNTRWYKAL